jgi:hypothetical protein
MTGPQADRFTNGGVLRPALPQYDLDHKVENTKLQDKEKVLANMMFEFTSERGDSYFSPNTQYEVLFNQSRFAKAPTLEIQSKQRTNVVAGKVLQKLGR